MKHKSKNRFFLFLIFLFDESLTNGLHINALFSRILTVAMADLCQVLTRAHPGA